MHSPQPPPSPDANFAALQQRRRNRQEALLRNQQAIALKKTGRLLEAVECYREAIRLDSTCAEAWFNLGLACHEQQQLVEAERCLQRAAELRPEVVAILFRLAQVQCLLHKLAEAESVYQQILEVQPGLQLARVHLAHVLKRQSRFDEAVVQYHAVLAEPADCNRAVLASVHEALGCISAGNGDYDEACRQYRAAVRMQPQAPAVLMNLGRVLHARGDTADAMRAFHEVLAAEPAHADAHFAVGSLCLREQRHREAVFHLQKAATLRPQHSDAWYNLGLALLEDAAPERAAEAFQQAIAVRPEFAEAHLNLGLAYAEIGEARVAIGHYEKALALRADFAQAYTNLGNAWRELHQHQQAVACYRRAAQLQPQQQEVHENLANALKDLGQREQAVDSFHRLSRLFPEQPLHRLRMHNLCPLVFRDRGEMVQHREELLRECRRVAEQAGRWRCRTEEIVRAATEPSFYLQFYEGNLRSLKESYAASFRGCFPARRLPPRRPRPRIGIVVTRRHEPIFLRSMRGVLQRLQGDFEIHIVCAASGAARIRAALPSITTCVLPSRFAQAVSRLHDEAFDVLYYWEVGTDATNYFLPFHRLAPVQCTSWGHQVTSGIPDLDYYLSSCWVEPPDAPQHYSEQLLLAQTLLTYQYPPHVNLQPAQRDDFGLPENRTLYLCAQNVGKFHLDFDPLLAEILRRDEQSCFAFTAEPQGSAVQRLRQRWQRVMPDVLERIHVVPRLADHEYRRLLTVADVLLDPPHFTGVNSTYDGLACFKPIVTMPGRYHRSRYTAACYWKMQLDGLEAASPEHYVEIATNLGTDPEVRGHYSDLLQQRTGCLFEDATAVDEHRRLFEQLLTIARS